MQKLRQEGEKATVINQAAVGITNPTPEEFASGEEDVFIYAVREGDTLGSIAQKYGINSNTILWANDLDNADMIHPGDQLFILPVSGVRYVVKSGDSIDSIAKRYSGKVEEIIAFNELPANGQLTAGEEIIIPDGSVPGETAQRPSTTTAPGTTVGGVDTSRKFNKYYYSSGAHRFPWGWCTWYVASRRHVPWGGNAGTWLYHAKAYGANTGRTPKTGAIIVTGESRWGHVGIVESVKGDTVTISEMNYKGFGVVSKRTINGKAGFVKGYIY
jgi:surface antigen